MISYLTLDVLKHYINESMKSFFCFHDLEVTFNELSLFKEFKKSVLQCNVNKERNCTERFLFYTPERNIQEKTNKQGKNNDCTLTISNVIIFVIIFIIIFFIIDWSTLGRNCTARSGVRAHLKVWNETCRKLWIVCNLKIEFIITFDIYLKAKLLCFLSIDNN